MFSKYQIPLTLTAIAVGIGGMAQPAQADVPIPTGQLRSATAARPAATPSTAPGLAAALKAMQEFQALPPGTIRYNGRTLPDPAEPQCWARSPQQETIDLTALCRPESTVEFGLR
ncbi:MAG: hypothetical protein VKK04_05110 [Synechococcales bacterium]|nr:hypothetical protein [Synechococcales bacterium]